MPLNIDYRPKSFSEIVGNQSTIDSLKAIYENRETDFPRAVLLQGPKGSGKTTIARIIANTLLGKSYDKCPSDFTMIDGGDIKVETVRDIKKLAYIRPMYGNARVWVIDECFPRGTYIETPIGQKPIEQIKPNETAFSLGGVDRVIAIAQRQVPLSRLILLKFSDGRRLFTTKDHVIFTQEGEIEAQRLNGNNIIFPFERGIYETSEISPDMPKSYSQMAKILFKRTSQFINDKTAPVLSNLWRTGRKTGQQIRLESSEIYKRGSNDQSFECIIGDKERNQGFVVCYDLQMVKHPSYFANGIPVHNCHMIGSGGASEKNLPQNNMLTLLEEPPGRAYFILCTTDPQRLIGTIRSRCHTFEMQYLRRHEMISLLTRTIKAEEDKSGPLGITPAVVTKVAEAADGCPRDALKILDQIIDAEPDKMEGAIGAFFYEEKTVADLCKAILNKESWNRVRLMVKQMDLSNPETIRRAITGWMAAEVMKGDSPLAALVYDNFQRPFYDNGKAGFIMAVYKTLIDIA
ncbi:MAG: AAA family ATPase [Gammaproteobacteria bacterium]|nr:AAA family ATPase [Gammaproteobacteria bacterium]